MSRGAKKAEKKRAAAADEKAKKEKADAVRKHFAQALQRKRGGEDQVIEVGAKVEGLRGTVAGVREALAV
jgi:hypothetical protein